MSDILSHLGLLDDPLKVTGSRIFFCSTNLWGASLHLGRWHLFPGWSLCSHPLRPLCHWCGPGICRSQWSGATTGGAGLESDVGAVKWTLQPVPCVAGLRWSSLFVQTFGAPAYCDEHVPGHWICCHGQCGAETFAQSKEGHVHLQSAIETPREFLCGAGAGTTCFSAGLLLPCADPLGSPCRSQVMAAAGHLWWPWWEGLRQVCCAVPAPWSATDAEGRGGRGFQGWKP